MWSRPRSSLAVVLLSTALASGCGKSSSTTAPTTPASDHDQVVATLSAASSLTDDDLEENPTESLAALTQRGGGISTEAAITPYKWWQAVNSITPTWSFAFSDTDASGHPTVCLATLSKHMTGSLKIVPTSDTTTTISKPIDKTLTREIKLQRLLLSNAHLWKVVGVTGAFVTTQAPNNTSHIVSIRLVATGVDTTLTDPTQFFTLGQVIHLAPSDSVHLTVTTSRTNDPVFIHLNGIDRWRLRNNLDGTYSTQWLTSSWPGWRHLGVQVMTHASLYDDTAAFDMQAWHFPFRVTQAAVAYYP